MIEIATDWLPSVGTVRQLEYQMSRYRSGEARSLATESNRLKLEMSKFLATVRAA